ncbi:MAG: matrixin family metalloprotease [Alphaproteobacteria bacterium]|nr:matrixin family metalloprotease [Alphaproteobacteria bacterium]
MIALLLAAHAYQPLSTCQGTPTHWNGVTTWHLTRGGSPMYSQLSDAEVTAAVTGGFDVWSTPTSCCSGFQHDNGGNVSQYYSLNDSTNIISFEENNWDWSLGSVNGVIAVTFSQWGWGCELSSGDQVFNGVGFDFTTTSNPGWGDTDLQSISAHENGHWLGLDHSSTSSATMYYAYPGGTSARSLHTDDENGVCNAYPATCGPQEQSCTDGVDDDSDGLTDCADPDCAGYSVCSCQVETTVSCGQTVSGSTYGQASTVESWGCANWETTGPEAVYSFSSAVSGPVTVDLTDLDADMDLFVTEANGSACNPNDCSSSGGPNTTPESVTIEAVAGRTYVVVADGWDGAESGYTLSITCPAGGEAPPAPPDEPPVPEPAAACAPVAALQCGTPVEGTSVGGTNDVEQFACVDWNTSGPEAVYSITPTVDGPVTLKMSNLTSDLDLFVTTDLAGGCDADGCVANSGSSDLSDEQLTFEAQANRTYLVVADGYDGGASGFTLLATCAGSKDPGGTGFDADDPFLAPSGCGCASARPGVAWGVLLVAAVLGRRRRS